MGSVEYFYCPECGTRLIFDVGQKFCLTCGWGIWW